MGKYYGVAPGGGGGVVTVNGDPGPNVVLDAEDVGAGQTSTGSYTGDDTLAQAIIGIGFLPKFVKVWERILTTNTAIASYETTDGIVDDNLLGQAINMANGKTQIGALVTLGPDGFTVGDQGGPAGGNHPNRLGIIYNFLAIG